MKLVRYLGPADRMVIGEIVLPRGGAPVEIPNEAYEGLGVKRSRLEVVRVQRQPREGAQAVRRRRTTAKKET